LIKDKIDNRTHKQPKILIYGYGNPGRQDDALGVLLSEKIEVWVKENDYPFITVDQNYQLNIEDAEYISNYDLVIFLDASVEEIESVLIEPVHPNLKTDFSMHSVTPAFVLGLTHQIFNQSPETFQLHIKGYKYNFMESLTEGAITNLETAFAELISFLKKYLISEKK